MTDRLISEVRVLGPEGPLPPPISFQVTLDVLTPGDSVVLEWPLTRRTWDLVPLDTELTVLIDGVEKVLCYVEERAEAARGTFRVSALDKMGRGLVKESVDGAGFSVDGLTLEQAALKCAGPWFDKVTFSNATNRLLQRGRGRKVSSGPEPIDADTARLIPRRIQAGETRIGALESILEPLGLLAWANGPGTELILTRPQYVQAAQYEIVDSVVASQVVESQYQESNAGRYATVEVSGSGRATGGEVGVIGATERASEFAQRHRIGVAQDDSGDFLQPARLFLLEQSSSADEAQAIATRILKESLAESRQFTATVPGLGEYLDRTVPTLYVPDTVARVSKTIKTAPDDDRPAVLIDEDMYVTAVTYSGARRGQLTTLTLVPLTQELV